MSASKIDHPLAEVRQRALQNLKLKLRTGAITKESIALDSDLLHALLATVKRTGGNQYAAERENILEFLDDLIDNPVGRAGLLNAEALNILESIGKEENIPEIIRRRSRALLGRLVHTTPQVAVEKFHVLWKAQATQVVGFKTEIVSPKQSVARGDVASADIDIATQSVLQEFCQPLYHCSADTSLTEADEQLLYDFRDSMDDVAHNRNLFEAVIYRLGPGVFLRRDDLLELLVEAVKEDAGAYAMNYLQRLVTEWSRECLGLLTTSHTVDAATPNSSSFLEDVDGQSNEVPQQIHVYATTCSGMFIRLIHCLGTFDHGTLLLPLLYGLLPAVRLQLSFRHDVESTAQIAKCLILELLGTIQSTPSSDAQVLGVVRREQIVCFAMDVVTELLPALKEERHFLASILHCFLNTAGPNAVPSTILGLAPNNLGKADQLYGYLLAHEQSWVRSVTIHELQGHLQTSTTEKAHTLIGEKLILGLVSLACPDVANAESRLASDILENGIDHVDGKVLRNVFPWLQMVYNYNDQLSNKVVDKVKPSNRDTRGCNFRTLLHRNRKLREQAASALIEYLDGRSIPRKEIPDVADALLLPLSLSETFEREPRKTSHPEAATLVERLLSHLRRSGADGVGLSQALHEVAESIHDHKVRQHSLDREVHSALLKYMQAHPPLDTVDMQAMIFIFRKLFEADRAGVLPLWKSVEDQDLFISLVFHPDARLRYEMACIFSQVILAEMPLDVNLLPAIKRSYQIVGVVNYPTSTLELNGVTASIWLACLKDYRSKITLPHTERKLVATERNLFAWHQSFAIDILKAAKSHDDFNRGLQALRESCNLDGSQMDGHSLAQVFAKIITKQPATLEDATLLLHVLITLRGMIRFPTALVALQGVFVTGLERLFLLLLQTECNWSDQPLASEELESDISTSLRREILSIGSHFFQNLPPTVVRDMISRTGIVPTLLSTLHHLVNSTSVVDHMSALDALSWFGSCVAASNAVESQRMLAESFKTIVEVAHIAKSDGSASAGTLCFGACELYSKALMCLRTLLHQLKECTVTDDIPTLDSLQWLWGEHPDDDVTVRSLKMGIAGDLLLLAPPDGVLEMAQAMDMLEKAFTMVDQDIVEDDYTSACLDFIGSFLACSFSRGIVHVEASGPAHTPVGDAMKLLDHHQFFAKVTNILSKDSEGRLRRRPVVLNSLFSLLLLVMKLDTMYCLETLRSSDIWDGMVAALTGKHPDQDTIADGCIVDHLKRMHRMRISGPVIPSLHASILEILWVEAESDEGIKRRLVASDTIFSCIIQILGGYEANKDGVLSESGNPLVDRQAFWGLTLCASMIHDYAAARTSQLEDLFRTSGGLTTLKGLQSRINRPVPDATSPLVRATCQLLSRILALHCSMVVDLSMTQILTTPCETGRDSLPIGSALCNDLIPLLLKAHDAEDAPLLESVRISLQCLLGCFDFVKHHAIAARILKKLAAKAQQLLHESSTFEQHQGLFAIISVFRHALAGSPEVKAAAVTLSLHSTLYRIMLRNDTDEMVMLECLTCLRNMSANSGELTKVLLEPAGEGARGMIGVNVILNVLRENMDAEVVFGAVEVLKIAVMQSEPRRVLWKMNIIAALSSIMDGFAKAKAYPKLAALLGFFRAYTYHRDGQVNFMRIDGAFDILLECLAVRNMQVRCASLHVLSLLAISKDNKATFLSNDAFFTALLDLLPLRNLDILTPLTGLIRNLLFDCQKSKIPLRRQDIKEQLDHLTDWARNGT
ncbi:uncharacterized protein EV422DRAFT_537484 [Fimicolochytrium jonesii]|uniref:uncharacterized protein n=1 Tax=Fimicolochytrium jonesii TaxID=1396493 RepID=UPI0022FED753|nr:uncharacterized protein EV422DRAFT_537484 [Fimicolochytrium jonesii]KAI8818560.1 hypothetical protein EV422DRAFT_537484 [Fimicolochytrium jonesii]